MTFHIPVLGLHPVGGGSMDRFGRSYLGSMSISFPGPSFIAPGGEATRIVSPTTVDLKAESLLEFSP